MVKRLPRGIRKSFKMRRQFGIKRLVLAAGRAQIRRAVVREVAKRNTLELKFHDVDLDDALVASAGTIVPTINIIPQGITEITRIGRKCTIRSIGWRFQLILPTQTAGNSTSDQVRVIMYLDKQANKATAAVLDILESADYQSFNNLNNKGRFRTIMDRVYSMNAQAGSGQNAADEYGEYTVEDVLFKQVNIPIEFTADTGAITEITSNNIGVLLISQSGLVAFESKIRLRFSDV